MKSLRYNLVDVFTDTALEGNPLAVFTNGAGLAPSLMQSIAREMNLSETVFLLPPQQGGHARLRIFTPRAELPFAGHPVLGSAWVLGPPMQLELLRLETGAGIIEVRMEREGYKLSSAFMTQPLPQFSPFEESALVIEALGVPRDVTRGAVTLAVNGPRHLLCEVESPDVLAALLPDMNALARIFDGGVLVFAVEADEIAHARYFAPGAGIPEDPATGSAAGPLGAYLVKSGRLESGVLLSVHQGHTMGRPSLLLVRSDLEDGSISQVVVGGSARVVGRGELMPY